MGQFSPQSWWQISVVHLLLLWGSFLRKGLCRCHGQSADANADANADADADDNDNDGGNNNANDNDGGNNNDKKDSDDDDNCRFESNDAIFFVSAALLFDLPFLTTFVGVIIEIDGLHLFEVLASDSV